MMMLGAKEPSARPTEHDRHPNMVTIRNPNLLRSALITGPRKQKTPIMIDEAHAAMQKIDGKLINALFI